MDEPFSGADSQWELATLLIPWPGSVLQDSVGGVCPHGEPGAVDIDEKGRRQSVCDRLTKDKTTSRILTEVKNGRKKRTETSPATALAVAAATTTTQTQVKHLVVKCAWASHVFWGHHLLWNGARADLI